jgi:uncharacterized membrane protein YfcA
MFEQIGLVAFGVATFMLAGADKGLVGMGLPTIVMGLLAAVMPLPQAAALMVLPSFVTNIWQVWRGPSLLPLLLRLWPLLLGICVGAWLGAGWLTSGGKLATVALGGALALYAGLGLATWNFEVRSPREPWLSAIAGVATGVVTAATGIYVIPAGPYLQAIGLKRDELVQALGLSFTVSTVALAAVLAFDGALQIAIAGVSALAVVPALAGMWLGQWLRARVDPERFRIYFLVALFAIGIHLIVRGVL